MASDQCRDARRIALQVVELPHAEREAAIARWCGEDAVLRAEVEAIAGELAKAMNPATAELAIAPACDAPTSGTPGGVGERGGQMIGRYKLLQPIGEGGFGSVWMAEQREPVKRRVALKIIKLGMDTKQVVARFEAERQALAMMDHPNIATVFDAGSTETGRPYFVMEYIKGVPIIEYCDTGKLDTVARLNLFTSVCQAIQHAHQKGIIHRDIKPSNVLVTMHDGVPVPKVIDFGIAKATGSELTSKTLFTEHRQIIGTPAYMSPEQAEMSGLDIDTRSDIYSLGVLLYELLTGTTPFPHRELMSGGFAEMMRIIREVEPHKPSTRLSTLGEVGARTAERRGTGDLRTLESTLRGDLDWIVMKCLEKDRTRRYESASGLAADVARHLGDEPVTAGPPGAAYRARKFVKRNRGRVIAAGVIAGALVLGVIGTSLGMVWAFVEKSRADAEAANATRAAAAEAEAKVTAQNNERKALAEARRAEAINAFVTTALRSSDPVASGARGTTIVEAMSNAIRDLDAGAFHNDPATEAALRETIGVILTNNGGYGQALPLLEESLATRERILPADDPIIAVSLNNLAGLCQAQGAYERAEALYLRALAINEKALGPTDPAVASNLSNLGLLAQAQGRYPDAESQFRRALAIWEIAPDAHAVERATTLNNLAMLQKTQGRFSEAETLYAQSLAIYEKALSPKHPYVANTLGNLGEIALGQGRFAEAEDLFQRSIAINEAALDGDHPSVAVGLNNLATLYEKQGRLDDAERLLRRALAINERVLGGQHPNVAIGLNNLANILLANDRYQEAEALYSRALAITEATFGAEHPTVALNLANLAQLQLALDRPAAAEPLFVRAIAIFEKSLGPNHPNTLVAKDGLSTLYWARGATDRAITLSEEVLCGNEATFGRQHPNTLMAAGDLGVVYKSSNRLDRAIPLLREAYRASTQYPDLTMFGPHLIDALASAADPQEPRETEEIAALALELAAGARASLPSDSSALAEALALLGLPLLKAHRGIEAEPILRESLAIRERVEPDAWTTFNTRSLLGGALLVQRRLEESEPLLLRGYLGLKDRESSIPPQGSARLTEAIERLVRLYEAKGPSTEAAVWRTRLEEAKRRGSPDGSPDGSTAPD